MNADSCSFSISTSNNSIYDALFQVQNLLRFKYEYIMQQLSFDEWASVIFLVVDDILHIPEVGFQYVMSFYNSRKQDVISTIGRKLGNSDGSFKESFNPLLEALYVVGRFDILENLLQMCLEHTIHNLCRSLLVIPQNRLALYEVFSALFPHDKVNLVRGRSLAQWEIPDHHELLEVIFLRNVGFENLPSLTSDLVRALNEIERRDLAIKLRPFMRLDDAHLDRGLECDFSEIYPLPVSHPHGLCIIINVKDFDKSAQPSKVGNLHLTKRVGSDLDCDRLEGTFRLFGFSIVRLNDPGKMELTKLFNNLRKEARMSTIACLALCIMTHGDFNDNLYLSDHSVFSMCDLRKLCYNSELIGKPRLYFVQACRGEQNLKPMLLQKDTAVTSNSEADALIFASTVSGYRALRSPSEGSWFISDLCSSLQEIGHTHRLSSALMLTKSKLKDRVERFQGEYVTQIAEENSTLMKEVQLVRGEYHCFIEGITDLITLNVVQELLEDTLCDLADDELYGPHVEAFLDRKTACYY